MKPALYLDRDAARPGDRVAVHGFGAGRASVGLVRLRGLQGVGLPTGYLEQPIGEATTFTAVQRPVPAGSAAIADEGPAAAADTPWRWRLRVQPTLASGGGQILAWGQAGPRLEQSGLGVRVRWRGAQLRVPIDVDDWTELCIEYAAGSLRIAAEPLGAARWRRSCAEGRCDVAGEAVSGPLSFGRGFNGRIEAPRLEVDGRLVAEWCFADGMRTQQVPGRGPQARALELVNAPRRAVRSSRWDGTQHRWCDAPDHYAAIHFHDDDLADCAWPADGELRIPADADSGIYALRIATDDGVRHAPLFVRDQRAHELLFLASTFSYLAYGNSVWAPPSSCEARHPEEAALARRFGLSLYGRHRDGSGIGQVSRRRPILNLTPSFLGEAIGGQVLLNDDLRVIAWLERCGDPYGVVTDHDLHAEGDAALTGCRVLVTGTHPEYHSRESLHALHRFAARGGRILYMGGNGFYWRVAPLPDAPHVLELRRAEGGVRKWAEAPGEYYHQADGALGGLWRRIGSPPNALVGVGYGAQGFEDDTRAYVRTPASHDPRVAELFDGVAESFGRAGPLGAAAGYELDRCDPTLGSPPHALVVARSLPFGSRTTQAYEELLTPDLAGQDDVVRADVTFCEGEAGGATLAFGSILYAGALEESDGAGRLASNALRRFLDPRPFLFPTRAPDPSPTAG